MKKCLYCAEKIKDEAVVCRYCGRDLPQTEKKQISPANSRKRSPWATGAIWAAVFTVISTAGTLFRYHTPDFIFDITIGPIIDFLGWWLIITLITWIWRKNNTFLRVLLFLVPGIIFVLGILIVNYLNLGFSSIPISTPTAIPTAIPTYTPEPWWHNCMLGKLITDEKYDQLSYTDEQGQIQLPLVCMYGIVIKKMDISLDGEAIVYDIFPLDKPIPFLIYSKKKFIETNAGVGQCVFFYGYASRNNDKSRIFLAAKVVDLQQQILQQKTYNPIVQLIISTCK